MASEKRLIDANAMREDWLENGENEHVYDTNAVLESIDAQPTVDAVEVVHAEWLDGYGVHGGIKKYESIDCSNCGDYFKIESHDREYWKKRFKVCPFCGAKMDGGNEDG
jgi:PHP family Zn ribbon phosphoesterase